MQLYIIESGSETRRRKFQHRRVRLGRELRLDSRLLVNFEGVSSLGEYRCIVSSSKNSQNFIACGPNEHLPAMRGCKRRINRGLHNAAIPLVVFDGRGSSGSRFYRNGEVVSKQQEASDSFPADICLAHFRYNPGIQ